MAAADVFGLVVSAAGVLAYLVYALFRGEAVLGDRAGDFADRCSMRSRSSRVPSRYPLGLRWRWRGSTRRRLARRSFLYEASRTASAASSQAPTGPVSRTGRATRRPFSFVFSVALHGGCSTRSSGLQGHLFLNPDHMKAVPAHISLNTTASFITNTNWQFYGGEYNDVVPGPRWPGSPCRTSSISAAVGMAVLVAVMRGISRARSSTNVLGNFWVGISTARSSYLLLPPRSSWPRF